MKIKCNMIREDSRLPERKHYNDAGADVYTCGNVRIEPHSTEKVRLGFSLELPNGYVAYICPRSSYSVGGTVCELAPIDSGYRGEVFAIVSNLSSHAKVIPDGTRIGQLVILPCVMADFVRSLGDERETGGFGSTGEN